MSTHTDIGSGDMAAAAGVVRRRRVYYISGFDPRGASHYHRLYREEAEKQASLGGVEIHVGTRARRERHQHVWPVEARWAEGTVATDYRFLSWDDIVRQHWQPKLRKVVGDILPAYGDCVSCGFFKKLRAMFRGPFYSALYPPAYLIVVFMLTGMLASAVGALAHGWTGNLAAGLGSAAVMAAICWQAGIALGVRLGVFWLLRTYLFVWAWGSTCQDVLDARVEEFAEQIAVDQQTAPCDEVLLIGHSVGSMVAVSVAARLLQKLPAHQRSNLSLVTLGQCIPLLSMIPAATRFRESLEQLAADKDLAWYDMTARADALCFSEVNPLRASGLTGPVADKPTTQIVRPFRMFDAKTYARIKRNKLRLHFQYVMASALPDKYDYFRMTAGPGRLKPY